MRNSDAVESFLILHRIILSDFSISIDIWTQNKPTLNEVDIYLQSIESNSYFVWGNFETLKLALCHVNKWSFTRKQQQQQQQPR